MPNLACRICGRVVYTTAPLESLFAEERRCPRCGGMLFPDRRTGNRRDAEQPGDPPADPGADQGPDLPADDRRLMRRRRDDAHSF
jgi:hypothetical protein